MDQYRIITSIEGKSAIQAEHFKSEADAEEYIKRNADIILPGETVQIVVDYDTRIYPIWRRNRPLTKIQRSRGF